MTRQDAKNAKKRYFIFRPNLARFAFFGRVISFSVLYANIQPQNFKCLATFSFHSVISVDLVQETSFVEFIKDSIVYHFLRLNRGDPCVA